MEDFKFSKFFGISAPMAVLMGSARFKELTEGFHSFVGGKMLNSLKIELEVFKMFVVEGLEFSKTVDTESEDYKNFVRGLQVYLASKEKSEEMLPSAGEASPALGSDRTDLFGGLQGAEEKGSTEDAFGDLDLFAEDAEGPKDVFEDVFGDQFGDEMVAVPVILNLVQMGKEYEGEPQCSVPLNTHSKVILFFLHLQERAEALGLSEQEVQVIQEQYSQLPMMYTGRLKILKTGEVLDLEEKGDPLYHVLKTLQLKALSVDEGVPLIDRLISIARNAVEASSVNTRKFLGQNFTVLCSSRGYSIEQRMMDSLSSESRAAKLNRVEIYIRDCRELLSPPDSAGDRNLIRSLGIKSGDNETALQKLLDCQDLQAIHDSEQSHKFVAFIRICQENGQFESVFSSMVTVERLFAIYCEVTSWTNEKWLSALDMMVTDDPDRAGEKLDTGLRELYMVPPNFNIDEYCEELLMKYNVVGVTTKGLVFFLDSLRIVGKINTTETYSLRAKDTVSSSKTIVSALIQLTSLQRRLINPSPSFFVEARQEG